MTTQEFSPEFRWATACKLRFDAALLEYGACCAIGNDAMVQRAATGAIQALAIKLDADWQQARLAFGHPPPDMPTPAAAQPAQQPNGSAAPETVGKRKARPAPPEAA